MARINHIERELIVVQCWNSRDAFAKVLETYSFGSDDTTTQTDGAGKFWNEAMPNRVTYVKPIGAGDFHVLICIEGA